MLFVEQPLATLDLIISSSKRKLSKFWLELNCSGFIQLFSTGFGQRTCLLIRPVVVRLGNMRETWHLAMAPYQQEWQELAHLGIQGCG